MGSILGTLGKMASKVDAVNNNEALTGAMSFAQATGMSATGAIGAAGLAGAAWGGATGFMDDTGTIGGAVGGGVAGTLMGGLAVGGAVMTSRGRGLTKALGEARQGAREFKVGMGKHLTNASSASRAAGGGDAGREAAAAYAWSGIGRDLKTSKMTKPLNSTGGGSNNSSAGRPNATPSSTGSSSTPSPSDTVSRTTAGTTEQAARQHVPFKQRLEDKVNSVRSATQKFGTRASSRVMDSIERGRTRASEGVAEGLFAGALLSNKFKQGAKNLEKDIEGRVPYWRAGAAEFGDVAGNKLSQLYMKGRDAYGAASDRIRAGITRGRDRIDSFADGIRSRFDKFKSDRDQAMRRQLYGDKVRDNVSPRVRDPYSPTVQAEIVREQLDAARRGL